MDPEPFISAMVNVVCALISTDGLTFHPFPRSREADAPVPFSAIPPFPFSPLKFSGLIDRLFASDNRNILERLASMPLYFCCEKIQETEQKQMNRQINRLFSMTGVL